MPPMNYPLTIGSVSLDEGAFEAPNGDQSGLSDLGSKQKSVVREFPGGIITAQLYGSFPKKITWNGKLFGGNAMDRSFELQALCDNGQQVTFNWAQWNFDGFVEDYEVTARAPNEIDYKMAFRPLDNNSTVTGGNTLADDDPFSGTVSNAQNTMAQQTSAPASGYTFPTPVQDAVSSLNQSVNQALQQSGGSVANVPTTTAQNILNQATSVQNLLQPIISGPDPIGGSAAADLNGTVSTISTAFSDSLSPTITSIQVANPNLYQLSGEYYGTPLFYETIQEANGLSDPLPLTNGPIKLVIPVAPTSITSVPTVMQDALANAA